jgi:hypothetical protein
MRIERQGTRNKIIGRNAILGQGKQLLDMKHLRYWGTLMIRKLKTGEFRIYSRHADPKTGKRKNLGTFATRAKAEEHERAIQYFKHH